MLHVDRVGRLEGTSSRRAAVYRVLPPYRGGTYVPVVSRVHPRWVPPVVLPRVHDVRAPRGGRTARAAALPGNTGTSRRGGAPYSNGRSTRSAMALRGDVPAQPAGTAARTCRYRGARRGYRQGRGSNPVPPAPGTVVPGRGTAVRDARLVPGDASPVGGGIRVRHPGPGQAIAFPYAGSFAAVAGGAARGARAPRDAFRIPR